MDYQYPEEHFPQLKLVALGWKFKGCKTILPHSHILVTIIPEYIQSHGGREEGWYTLHILHLPTKMSHLGRDFNHIEDGLPCLPQMFLGWYVMHISCNGESSF